MGASGVGITARPYGVRADPRDLRRFRWLLFLTAGAMGCAVIAAMTIEGPSQQTRASAAGFFILVAAGLLTADRYIASLLGSAIPLATVGGGLSFPSRPFMALLGRASIEVPSEDVLRLVVRPLPPEPRFRRELLEVDLFTREGKCYRSYPRLASDVKAFLAEVRARSSIPIEGP